MSPTDTGSSSLPAQMTTAYDRLPPLTARLVRRELRSVQHAAREAWTKAQPAGSVASFKLEPPDSRDRRDESRGAAPTREHTATDDGWLVHDPVTVFFDRRRGWRTEEGTGAGFSVNVQHEAGHYQSLGGRLVVQPEPGSGVDSHWPIFCPCYALLDPRWFLDEGEILDTSRGQTSRGQTSRGQGIDAESWTIKARPTRYVQAPVGFSGATEFRGVVDAKRGILLALSGRFEDEAFASLELIDATFDVDLPDGTFRLP